MATIIPTNFTHVRMSSSRESAYYINHTDNFFIKRNYTYILELYNGDKFIKFNHSQEYIDGFRNREKPHPKFPNDPRMYYFVNLMISRLYFEYESFTKFIEDFSELDRIVFKMKDNNTDEIYTLYDNKDKYYLTSYDENKVTSHTIISDIMDRITLSDIQNVDNVVLEDNSVRLYGSLSYTINLIKYMRDPSKTDEENYEYIKNNYKTYLTEYVFEYSTRIEHNKEN